MNRQFKKKMKPSKIGPISIDFFDSEVVGIIGKNGSGKSTLLRIAGGVYPPDKGDIRLLGSISMLAGVGVDSTNILPEWRTRIYMHH